MLETRRIGFFTFERNPRGWLVSGYEGPEADVVIPGDVDGEPVTMVGSYAFEDNQSLVSVTIPDTVDFLGKYAFWGCRRLERARLPAAADSLSLGLFMGCTSLTEVDLPAGLGSIGDGAFNGCTSLVGVAIPPKVSVIGDSAFRGCSSLAAVELPYSVKKIFRSAFRDCESLSSVVITDSVKMIGPRAFQGCPRLDSISILGNDIDGTLTALSDYGFMHLVADYAVPRRLMPFDDARQMLSAPRFPYEKVLAARMLAAYPERLDEVAAKLVLIRTLAQAGLTAELRVLEGKKGYFTEANLQKCIEAASSAGRIETAAYLMERLANAKGAQGASSSGFRMDDLAL
ncbi:MAG: leucine-rich repeat domain-containing protein [Eggerthellaceae bacterium]